MTETRTRPHLRQVVPERTEEPLIPPTPAEKWTPMSASQQVRLLLWRQIWAAWPIYLLLVCGIVMSWIAGPGSEEIAQSTAVVLMSCVALALGYGPVAREESFWVGLGGSPRLRELVSMGTHVTVLVAAGLLIRPVLPELTGIGVLLALATYSVTGFVRAWSGTVAVRLLLTLGLVAGAAATLLPFAWISAWPWLAGIVLRLGLLSLLCFVARPFIAASRPASAAGRRKVGWLLLAMPLSVGLLGPLEWIWPTPTWGDRSVDWMLMVPEASSPWIAPQRVWRQVDGEWEKTGLKGVSNALLVPSTGAIAYEREVEGGLRIGLFDDGVSVECDAPSQHYWTWAVDEGLLAVGSGWGLVVGEGGCQATARQPEGIPIELLWRDDIQATEDWKVVEVLKRGGRESQSWRLLP